VGDEERGLGLDGVRSKLLFEGESKGLLGDARPRGLLGDVCLERVGEAGSGFAKGLSSSESESNIEGNAPVCSLELELNEASRDD
jgi:hypothetical protein